MRHFVAPDAAAWQHIGRFGGVARRFEATGANAEASERSETSIRQIGRLILLVGVGAAGAWSCRRGSLEQSVRGRDKERSYAI